MAFDALAWCEDPENKRWWLEMQGVSGQEAEELWAHKVDLMLGRNSRKTPMVFVSQDVHYESPTTGRVITNRQARLEDMKASGCIEYDPEMRTDYQRRIKDSEAKLDREVDHTVDKMIAELPGHKREQLVNEMAAGLTAEPVRQTLGASNG
jgi:hypothetical protein